MKCECIVQCYFIPKDETERNLTQRIYRWKQYKKKRFFSSFIFSSSKIYQSFCAALAGSFVIPKIRHKPDYCLWCFQIDMPVIKISSFLLWCVFENSNMHPDLNLLVASLSFFCDIVLGKGIVFGTLFLSVHVASSSHIICDGQTVFFSSVASGWLLS